MAIDVLAEMDQEKQERGESSGGTFKFVFLTMSVGPKKNNQPTTVGQKTSFRPLYALDQVLLMWVHSDYDKATGKYMKAICAREIGKPCYWCEQAEKTNNKKLAASKSLMLPVWMIGLKDQYDPGGEWFALKSKNEDGTEKPIAGMRILELQNFGAIAPVYGAIRRVHSGDTDEQIAPRDIRSLDFVVECHGVGTDKKLTPDRRDPSPMSAEIKAAIPKRDAVRDMILDARPPRGVGETAPVAPTQPATLPASSAKDEDF